MGYKDSSTLVQNPRRCEAREGGSVRTWEENIGKGRKGNYSYIGKHYLTRFVVYQLTCPDDANKLIVVRSIHPLLDSSL